MIITNKFNLLNILQESRILLFCIVENYNFIRQKTEKCELDIIFGQVNEIDVDLTILLEKFTWINFGMNFCIRSFVKLTAII